MSASFSLKLDVICQTPGSWWTPSILSSSSWISLGHIYLSNNNEWPPTRVTDPQSSLVTVTTSLFQVSGNSSLFPLFFWTKLASYPLYLDLRKCCTIPL